MKQKTLFPMARRLSAVALLAVLITSTQAQIGKEWSATRLSVAENFDVPECLAFDPATKSVFVSNISAGEEAYWSNDSKGFISLLDADGKVKQLRWLDSTPAQPIHSPKGLCIVQGYLYFTDNAKLKRCAIAGGSPGKIEEIEIPGARKLNDLATDGRAILVSDTEAGKVHRFEHGSAAPVEIAAIEGVNGVTFHLGRMFAVSWALHDIYEIQPNITRAPRAFGLASHFTNLDGIEVLDDGTFIVSDFKGNKVCTISPDRKVVRTLITLDSPADIGIDHQRKILYVPQFMKNQAAVYQLTK